jgi:TonB-linked SusC/RagA family outer membrane protein
MQLTAKSQFLCLEKSRKFIFPSLKMRWLMRSIPQGGGDPIAPAVKTIVRAMKFTAFLLLAACLQVSARTDAQSISLNEKKAPLEKVLREIRKQSGYTLFYDEALVKKKGRPVDITVKNTTVEEALNLVFLNQVLTFEIAGKTILVKEPEPTTRLSTVSPPKLEPLTNLLIDISGRITDTDGNPLEAATIKVKGTNITTTTNSNGEFQLTGIDENATLEISFVGYETITVAVNNRTSITAFLKVEEQNLNEVVINKGYYTEKQRLSTGNVTKVQSKDIEKSPVGNPLLALQGRVPGLVVTQTSGVPGGGVTVRIQGQNSLRSGNDPLYVINGVPFASQTLSTTSVGGTILRESGSSVNSEGGSGNPLNYINLDDIESIEILKDADATSIYGSRAANGAILITTKSGKSGATKVNINLQQGWGKVTRTIKVMNTQQYLEMRKEAFANDNVLISSTDANYDVNGLWDQSRYTDWVKELIGGTAKYTNLNASISGGSDMVQYLVGATYRRESTVFPDDSRDKKGSIHFNLNSLSNNKKFRANLSANYLTDDNKLPKTDYTLTAYTLAPNAPALFNDNGSLNWAPNLTGNASWSNPLKSRHSVYENKTDNLVSNAKLSYTFFRGLILSSGFGYSKLTTDEFSTNRVLSVSPNNRANYNTTRNAFYSNGAVKVFNIEPQLNYQKAILQGVFDLLFGVTIQQQKSNGQNLTGTGFATDDLDDMQSATTLKVNSIVDAVYKYNAVFGRLNYTWKDKYIFNFTARRDGSSRFGPENRFHNFASMAGAWIFSEEGFLKKNSKLLSFGKIKASYGTTGNDQIGDYTFLDTYVSNNGTVPFQGASSIQTNRIANPYLQWEETKKLSVGLDLGFFNDRMVVSGIYGRNRSSNLLMPYTLPIITGFTSVVSNFPATIQNTSWEISLTSTNFKGKAIHWTTSLNLTIPRNKLIAFPNLKQSSYASSLVIGKPITMDKVYVYLGVNPALGIYQYAAANGGITSNPSKSVDSTVFINVDPKFYGGLNNTFRYKRFEVAVLFQFFNQVGNNAYQFGMGTLPPGYSIANQPVSVIDRWQKPHQVTSVQRYSANSTSALNAYLQRISGSNAAYVDASYARLENISISYDFDKAILKKTGFESCRVYVQGQNLLTFSAFGGIDPENRSNAALAPLRVLSAGLQVGLK